LLCPGAKKPGFDGRMDAPVKLLTEKRVFSALNSRGITAQNHLEEKTNSITLSEHPIRQ
jgi:hypothetical protein